MQTERNAKQSEIANLLAKVHDVETLEKAYYLSQLSIAVEFVEIHAEDCEEELTPEERRDQSISYTLQALGHDFLPEDHQLYQLLDAIYHEFLAI